MGLGEPDASGRRRPEPIAGSEFVLDVDSIVVAIGQQADLSFLEGVDVKRTERGAIDYDKLTLQTSDSKLFVAGEVVTGAGAAIEAIASGHEAAESVRRFLVGEDLDENRTPQVLAPTFQNVPVAVEWVEKERRRAQMPMIPLSQRISGFKEVELGFDRGEAIHEAQRCLVCETGSCSGCTMCARTCPALCIAVDGSTHTLDMSRCMFCGLCAEACPTGALVMSNEFESSEVKKDRLLFVRNI
jgi:pyruvate/2-oxoglutarate dehydrogenase complex dihydrolipoamide dehydrogenase (E3) component